MKILYLFIFLFLNTNSFSQNWEWFSLINSSANGVNGLHNRGYSSISTDPFGNTYVIGNFVYINLGDSIYYQTNSSIFLTKYDAFGKRQWTNVYEGSRECRAFSVKTDRCGNVYFVGTPRTGFIYLTANRTAPPLFDPFIVKLNPEGELIWTKPIPNGISSTDFDLDHEGNLYFIFPTTNGNFGNIQVTNLPSGPSISFGKMTEDGKAIWVKQKAGRDFTDFASIDYNNGKLSATYPLTTGEYAFVLDTAGNTIRTFTSSTGDIKPVATHIDNQGNFLFIGSFTQTIRLRNTSVTALGTKDFFFASFSSSGALNWYKHYYGTGSNTLFATINDVISDIDGNYFVCGSFTDNFHFDLDSISTVGGNNNAFIAKYDGNGNKIYIETIKQINPNVLPQQQYHGLNQIRSMEPLEDGSIHISGLFQANDAIFDSSIISSIGQSEYTFYLSKYINNLCASKGVIYFDSNNNGVKDSTEDGESNVVLYKEKGTDTLYTLSNEEGEYTFYSDSGNYSIGLASNIKNWNLNQSSQNSYFTNLGSINDSINFTLSGSSTLYDLSVDIGPFSDAALGDTSKFQITVKNVGTATTSGTISLVLDSLLTDIQFSQQPSMQNGKVVDWTLNNLAINNEFKLTFTANLDSHAVIMDSIRLSVLVRSTNTELDTTDNTDSLKMYVKSKSVPNQIIVQPAKPLSIKFLNESKRLNYIVFFQNITGDTIEELTIKNNLSSLLDIKSLKILSSSHKFNASLNSESSILTFKSDKLILADSSSSQLGSKGFIKFSIQPMDNITVNDTIENSSIIYYSICTIDSALKVSTSIKDTSLIVTNIKQIEKSLGKHFYIFPNPAKNYIIVNGDFDIKHLEIYNINGQAINFINKVSFMNENQIKINLDHFPSGLYIIKSYKSTAKFQKI